MTPNALLSIDVHLGPDDLAAALRRDVADGLSRTPKQLPPKWFYDARGSQLFDEITRLADYYPTRREREILEREAATIAALSGADTIIELGSGTSDKTRLLLDAFVRRRQLERFVPFDVDEATLREAGTALARAYPEVSVRAVVGDFEHHLHHLPTGGRRMVAFLGSTIGNLVPEQRAQFFRHLRSVLEPGDSLLLGADLVKDPARLVAAYDDAEGVTAEFNRNVLHVINRELAADFRPDRFEHVAVWDPDQEWIEMRLRSTDRQSVRLDRLDTSVTFSRGEEIRTEISAKFRASTVIAELEAAGFDLSAWWIDRAGDFALSLSTIR